MNLYHILAGYNTRFNYWSDSSFGKWIYKRFGMWQNPYAAELGEFKRIRDKNAQHHPYITWFVEDGLDVLQDFIYFPMDVFNNGKRKLTNRFVDKYFYINTKLPKWEYSEVSERILHGIFQTVVEFVEGEKAHMNDISETDKANIIKDRKQAGLKYLDWEISLGDEVPHQSYAAKELKEIYLWYKDIRPNRLDPMDVSGLTEHYENKGFDEIFSTKENEFDQAKMSKMLNICRELEEQYEAEDQDNLIRIMMIRQSMWT